MAETLLDLAQVLRSKQEKLTRQEANFLMTWKANTIQQLTIGACAGGAIAWSATGNVSRMLRINLASGAAAMTGAWRFRRSVNSCIEQILGMDGSRMQRELATIMLKRYPNHPMTTKLLSKRFYCEHVYDDSTADTPKSRWRFRNNFVENQSTTDNHPELDPVPVVKKGFTAMENPFDCIFGVPASVEEIRRPANANANAKSPRKHNHRKQRRSHRRHNSNHRHHDDDSSS